MAFVLYWFGVFSPGDSKLFWGLCLIFPVSLFRNVSGVLSFPPLVLVLNIIIPYSVGILSYLLFKFALMRNRWVLLGYLLKSNLDKISVFEVLFYVLQFIGIGSALTYVLAHFGWEPSRFLHLVFVLGTFTLLQRLLSLFPKTVAYYAVISFACVCLALQATLSVSAFLTSFALFLGLYFLVFVIAKELVLSLTSITLNSAVDMAGLEVGMIPAEQIVRVEVSDGTVHYEKRPATFSGMRDDNTLISPDPAGLSAEEILELQTLAMAGAFVEFGNRVNIQPSIRFAPIIFGGALLTVLCRGPFYLKLMEFL